MPVHQMHPDPREGLLHEVRRAQRRLERISDRTEGRSDDETARHALRHLRLVLAELATAAEELQTQNEALVAAQASAEAHRRRFEDLFLFAPEAYVVTDVSGTIREGNVAASRLFGVPLKHLAGTPLPEFVAQDARRDFRAALAGVVATGETRPWSIELRRRDGEVFPAEISVDVSVERPGDTASLRWLVRDVSEQTRMRRRLEQLNAELEHRVGERTADLEHTLTEVSELAEQLQVALDSRVVIEQAKGRVMERTGLDGSAAFELIRGHARRNRIRLRDVCRSVVDGSLPADELCSGAGQPTPGQPTPTADRR